MRGERLIDLDNVHPGYTAIDPNRSYLFNLFHVLRNSQALFLPLRASLGITLGNFLLSTTLCFVVLFLQRQDGVYVWWLVFDSVRTLLNAILRILYHTSPRSRTTLKDLSGSLLMASNLFGFLFCTIGLLVYLIGVFSAANTSEEDVSSVVTTATAWAFLAVCMHGVLSTPLLYFMRQAHSAYTQHGHMQDDQLRLGDDMNNQDELERAIQMSLMEVDDPLIHIPHDSFQPPTQPIAIRQEQDYEYEEALMKDQMAKIKHMEDEKEEKKMKEQEEQEKALVLSLETRLQAVMDKVTKRGALWANQLMAPGDDEEKEVVLRIRLPDRTQVEERVSGSASMATVFSLLEGRVVTDSDTQVERIMLLTGSDPSLTSELDTEERAIYVMEYQLVSSHPRRLYCNADTTLSEAGLAGRAMLLVEPVYADTQGLADTEEVSHGGTTTATTSATATTTTGSTSSTSSTGMDRGSSMDDYDEDGLYDDLELLQGEEEWAETLQ